MAHGDGWKLWQQLNGNGGGLIFTLLQLILIITLFLAFYFQNKNKFLSLSLLYTVNTGTIAKGPTPSFTFDFMAHFSLHFKPGPWQRGCKCSIITFSSS